MSYATVRALVAHGALWYFGGRLLHKGLLGISFWLDARMPVHAHAHCMYTHIHMHTHTDVHAYIHTHTHICTRTYIQDDKIEVLEVKKANSGRDNFPKLVKKQRIPRAFRGVPSMGSKESDFEDEYINDQDLLVGTTVEVCVHTRIDGRIHAATISFYCCSGLLPCHANLHTHTHTQILANNKATQTHANACMLSKYRIHALVFVSNNALLTSACTLTLLFRFLEGTCSCTTAISSRASTTINATAWSRQGTCLSQVLHPLAPIENPALNVALLMSDCPYRMVC